MPAVEADEKNRIVGEVNDRSLFYIVNSFYLKKKASFVASD